MHFAKTVLDQNMNYMQYMLALLDTSMELKHDNYSELQDYIQARTTQVDNLAIMSALIAGFGFFFAFDVTTEDMATGVYSFANVSSQTWYSYTFAFGAMSACMMTLCAVFSTLVRIQLSRMLSQFLRKNHYVNLEKDTELLNKLSIPFISTGPQREEKTQEGWWWWRKVKSLFHGAQQKVKQQAGVASGILQADVRLMSEVSTVHMLATFNKYMENQTFATTIFRVSKVLFYVGLVCFFVSFNASVPLHFTNRQSKVAGIVFVLIACFTVFLVVVLLLMLMRWAMKPKSATVDARTPNVTAQGPHEQAQQRITNVTAQGPRERAHQSIIDNIMDSTLANRSRGRNRV